MDELILISREYLRSTRVANYRVSHTASLQVESDTDYSWVETATEKWGGDKCLVKNQIDVNENLI